MSDEGLIFRSDLSTWLSEVQYEIHLLRVYVEKTEEQVTESIAEYHREREFLTYETGDPEFPEEGFFVHRNVDGSTFHLPTIFEDYFPNLQRRSALITLFSFLEHELVRLCNHLQREKNLSILLTEWQVRDKGIIRTIKYLKRKAGLPINNGRGPWQEIRCIQELRNDIVHRNAKLKEAETINYALRSGWLSVEDGEVKIEAGYLMHIIDVFHSYFEQIGSLIPTLQD